jgi:cysteine synthase B
VPPILDLGRLDRKLLVSNRDSIVMTRRLAAEEGIFAGVSSGAVIHTCVRVASRMTRGTIVGIVCDGGWKYLSSGLWTDDVDDVEDTLDRGIFW